VQRDCEAALALEASLVAGEDELPCGARRQQVLQDVHHVCVMSLPAPCLQPRSACRVRAEPHVHQRVCSDQRQPQREGGDEDGLGEGVGDRQKGDRDRDHRQRRPHLHLSDEVTAHGEGHCKTDAPL